MGMGRMIGVWGQSVAIRSVPCADALDQPLFDQYLENAVESHLVHGVRSSQRHVDFLGTERRGAIADDLQDHQTMGRRSELGARQQFRVIAPLTHGDLFLFMGLQGTSGKVGATTDRLSSG
jgi:hypothetical protein